jgi:N-acetylmuramate 1-kinase
VSSNPELLQRQQALQAWTAQQFTSLDLGSLQGSLEAVSGDASFRRYFRGTNFCGINASGHYILVDAPPPKEDCTPFVNVAQQLLAAGVRVPRVLTYDLAQGFMCLEDFGNALLWPALEAARVASNYDGAQSYYQRCFEELLLIQQATVTSPLPHYDEALLLREMRLFTEWCCEALLQLTLTPAEHAIIEQAFASLVASALQQPQVLVHRDYHSRNLMLLSEPGRAIGVIDFQDAVIGPWTYDVVSLLKDCYIEWPQQQVREWLLLYAEQAKVAGILPAFDPAQALQDFDFMGAQRHIKVLGIFSRLWLRDGKAGYLNDMPLTFRYLQQVMNAQPQFAEFAQFLQQRIEPQLAIALAAVQATARAQGSLP